MKALVLFSGGLDSILALRLVQSAGIDVEILSFYSAFGHGPHPIDDYRDRMEALGRAFGAPVTVLDHTEALVEALENPAHGYGKNFNPCIDCRIAMFRRARGLFERFGASFLVTGEVLGQRPMSQRRQAMELIDRKAGVQGLVFRPLSAGVLDETIPEKEGWIRREDFPAVKGRSRKPQLALAQKLGVSEPPGSGGGCLLTYAGYAKKAREAVERGDLDVRHAKLLRFGRHFRAPGGAKVVMGRNEGENETLERTAGASDALVTPLELAGPAALVLGASDEAQAQFAASLCGRYMKVPPGAPVRFELRASGMPVCGIEAPAFAPAEALAWQIA
jgi:hypothetical protein